MAQVIYAPAAGNDLADIAEFIARDKPVAARNWVQRIRDTCETFAKQPEIGELRTDLGIPGCRSSSVGNYVIFFRAMVGGIEVVRILQGSRDTKRF